MKRIARLLDVMVEYTIPSKWPEDPKDENQKALSLVNQTLGDIRGSINSLVNEKDPIDAEETRENINRAVLALTTAKSHLRSRGELESYKEKADKEKSGGAEARQP